MEKYTIHTDIKVLCITATSFPAGVLQAHQQLHALLPGAATRTFYGISQGSSNGSIIYKAAAAAKHEAEAEQLQCETFIIQKGSYISQPLHNWMQDTSIVEKTFKALLQYPGIDKNGYCLEIYDGDNDMICLVKLHTDD